jgi:hypothetical protein
MRNNLQAFAITIITLLIVGSCLPSMTQNARGDESNGDQMLAGPPALPQPLKAWTLVFYMAGDNDLEKFMISQLNALELVGSTADVNIVVALDRWDGYYKNGLYDPLKDDTSNGNWVEMKYFYVTYDADSTTINSYSWPMGEKNTGNPTTLTNYFSWVQSNFPANNFALILGDHGAGYKGVCWDEDITAYEEYITIPELQNALADIYSQLGNTRLELLGFDACWCASIEVISKIAPYVDVVVAPENYEPGSGWPLQPIAQRFVDIPQGSAAWHAQNNIVPYYDVAYPGWQVRTMSAYFCSNFQGSFVPAMNQLAMALVNDNPAYNIQIKNAWVTSQKMNSIGNEIVDIVHFCENLRSGTIPVGAPTYIQAGNVITAHTNALIAEIHGSIMSNAHGVSAYVSDSMNTFVCSGDNGFDFYRSSGGYWSTNWCTFISKLWVGGDTTAPLITVNQNIYPASGYYNTDPGAVINVDFTGGTTTPSYPLSALDSAQYQIGANWYNIFTENLDSYTANWAVSWYELSVGANSINIRCYDMAGNVATQQITIYKLAGPQSAPILIFPYNDFTVWDTRTPTFDWSDSCSPNGVQAYEILIDDDPCFGNIDYDWSISGNPPSSTYTPGVDIPDGNWYWKVRALDNTGCYGDWSATWSFRLDLEFPSASTGISPLSYAIINPVTFDWTDSIDIGGVSSYTLSLRWTNGGSFYSWNINGNPPPSTFTLPINLYDGGWTWWVRAVDYAYHGINSPQYSFILDTIIPSTPTLTAPSNGAILGGGLFGWWTNSIDTGSGLGSYELLVSSDPTFNIISYDWIITGNPPPNYGGDCILLSNTYYWKVRAIDNAGNIGGWSPPNYFISDGTAPLSHVNSLSSSQPSVTFTVSWTGSDDYSGVRGVGIYYRKGSTGPWVFWRFSSSPGNAQFTGTSGYTYYFYSRAEDNALNKEDITLKQINGETQTTISCTNLGGIDGHVFYEGTTTPVTNARVYLTIGVGGPDQEVRNILTNNNGYYSFSNVPEGSGTVNVFSRSVTVIVSTGITIHADIYVPSTGTLQLSWIFSGPGLPPGATYTGTDYTIWKSDGSKFYGVFKGISVSVSLPIGVTYSIRANVYFWYGGQYGVYWGSDVVDLSSSSLSKTIVIPTTSPFPGSSCPFVYSWNGTAYTLENSILEGSPITGKISDALPLGNSVSFDNNKVSIAIAEEDEYEYTVLDSTSMVYVGYENGVTLATTPDGEIQGFSQLLQPVTAIDGNGNDTFELIAQDDGISYNGTANDYIIVDFDTPLSLNTRLVIRSDYQCRPSKLYEGPAPIGPIYVDIMDANGDWERISTFWPKDLWTYTIIDLSGQQNPQSGNIKIRLTWGAYHLVDCIGLDILPEPNLEMIAVSPTIAHHSNGTSAVDILKSDDNLTVQLNYGERVCIDFPLPIFPESLTVTPVLMITGQYIPIVRPSAVLKVDTTEVLTYETVTFNASESFYSNGTISKYLFEYGDGNNSGWIDSPVVTHVYTDGDATYLARVTVKNNDGLMSVNSNNASIFITVHNRSPVPEIDVYQIINITLMVSGRKDNTVTLKIFEDGVLINSTSVTRQPGDPKAQAKTITLHKYLGHTYVIQLFYDASHTGENPTWVTFKAGTFTSEYSTTFNTNSGNHQNRIVPSSYLDSVVAHNKQFYFDARASYDIDGTVVSYQWDFGDTQTETNAQTTHTYRSTGDYVITLRVTDDDGAISVITYLIHVG